MKPLFPVLFFLCSLSSDFWNNEVSGCTLESHRNIEIIIMLHLENLISRSILKFFFILTNAQIKVTHYNISSLSVHFQVLAISSSHWIDNPTNRLDQHFSLALLVIHFIDSTSTLTDHPSIFSNQPEFPHGMSSLSIFLLVPETLRDASSLTILFTPQETFLMAWKVHVH